MCTVGGSGGFRPNDIMSCFVLSPFSWNLFSFDQWLITSTASCDLLCVDPLSMVSDTFVSSTYFNMSKILGTDKSLIIKRKSHGPSLRHATRYLAPLREAISPKLHSLGFSGKKLSDPVDYAIGNIDLFDFTIQDSVVDEIESLPVIENKDPHS